MNVGPNNDYSRLFYQHPKTQYYRAEDKINQYPNKNSSNYHQYESPWIESSCWPSNTSKVGLTVGLKPMNGICNYREDAGLIKMIMYLIIIIIIIFSKVSMHSYI